MRLWNEINWPAMNRRARQIEAELWRWSPEPDDFKAKSAVKAITQADRIAAQALMVWSDDGGSTD